jgi:hypothetical protein
MECVIAQSEKRRSPPPMTPEQILFETACNALHLEVTPDIANDIRQRGREAITAAVAGETQSCVKALERLRDDEYERHKITGTKHQTMVALAQEYLDALNEAIETIRARKEGVETDG